MERGQSALETLAMTPEIVIQHLQQLSEAFAAKDLATALMVGEKLCAQGALGVTEAMSLADYLEKSGNVDAAIALYSQWLEKTTSLAAHIVYFNLSILLDGKNDFIGSEAALKRAITHQPTFIEAYINLGNLYERQQLPDLALSVWSDALTKIHEGQPNYRELQQLCLNNLGRLFKSLNRFYEAEHVLLRSLALVPEQAVVLSNLEELRHMATLGDRFPEIYPLNDTSLNRAKQNYLRMSVLRTPEHLTIGNNAGSTIVTAASAAMAATAPHFYCISHAPCSWPLPKFMTVFGTGDYCPEGGIAMSIHSPEQAFKNRYLGEYVALYMIRDILIEKNATGFVGLCHYRRFALTRQHGELRGFNYQLSPDTFATLKPEDFYGNGTIPIIPAVVGFRCSMLTLYSIHCVARDLLLFFGSAIDCNAISSHEASEFLSGNYFITAPTVAYMPIEWFIEIVNTLEKVMDHFFAKHYIERQGYLERSMAFCCERLQAFLLLKFVRAHGFENVISQPLSLIT